MDNWWKTFFDSDYVRIWGGRANTEQTAKQVQGVWELLRLREGSRVLDAPCGYGRLSLPIAMRGADVVGVDQSAELINKAEKDRGDLPTDRLRYFKHDLREPLAEDGFDAAFNVYSSIGYGTEKDDLAIFKTLHSAVRPGGLVLIDTMHRDAVAALLSCSPRPSERLPDGTLLIEESTLDPISGRVDTTWFGPAQQAKARNLLLYDCTPLRSLFNFCKSLDCGSYRLTKVVPLKCSKPKDKTWAGGLRF